MVPASVESPVIVASFRANAMPLARSLLVTVMVMSPRPDFLPAASTSCSGPPVNVRSISTAAVTKGLSWSMARGKRSVLTASDTGTSAGTVKTRSAGSLFLEVDLGFSADSSALFWSVRVDASEVIETRSWTSVALNSPLR